MAGFDFNKVPKLMVDSASINYTPQHFLLAFSSGPAASAYVLPPPLMKAMLAAWSEKVADYERQHGPIDTRGAETGIQSPLQM
ncbi:MAG TPA: hypothetical protein VHC68_01175 [Candidatus Paceibacterota bacterium]|nr:hypothetical protein [Candidatus Paceibacterota bacterium]